MSLYVMALAMRWGVRSGRSGRALSRLAWTGGCALFLLHVTFAFEFHHAWSHTFALAATARRTEQIIGVRWGGGLYLNYLFMVLWMADVCWWWLSLERYEARDRVIEGCLQCFFALMWFNATVVFGRGVARWLGLSEFLVLSAALWVRYVTQIHRRHASCSSASWHIPRRRKP